MIDLKEVSAIGAWVIGSVGSAGAIIVGLSNYLGKMWADRGLEKQRHEYSQLNIAFQNQLDIASRRLQIELDALGLVHKLRTEKEFNQMGALYQKMAILKNTFSLFAQLGLTLSPADAEALKKQNARVREHFDTELNDAVQFIAENGLFIPKHICDVAEAATKAAFREQFTYAIFREYVENPLPRSFDREDNQELVNTRQQYFDSRNECFAEFSEAMKQFDELCRQHIEGKRLSEQSRVANEKPPRE